MIYNIDFADIIALRNLDISMQEFHSFQYITLIKQSMFLCVMGMRGRGF